MALDIARMIGYGVVLLGIAYPLGLYMARVFSGEKTWLTPVLAPVERVVYRIVGIDPNNEMPWTVYAVSSCCSTSRASRSSTCCCGSRASCR